MYYDEGNIDHDGRARIPTGVHELAITIYGVCAVSFMMAMYALERRSPWYILGFSVGCILSSIYGFLSGAWPFGVVELIWSGVAFRRYFTEARIEA